MNILFTYNNARVYNIAMLFKTAADTIYYDIFNPIYDVHFYC